MNAVACAAFMTRAGMEAWTFACSREAFGQPIANYPMIQESVADIHAEAAAATASSFALAALVDRIDTGLATDDEAALFRLLVNVNKYITSIRGSEAIHQAIEVLGGNGAIESFSILPRLYRDMIVLESWEGAHNVLALQVLRDISKYGIHDPFIAWVETLLNGVADTDLVDLAALTRGSLERINRLLNRMNVNEGLAQAHARRLIEGIGACSQAALLLAETSWELHEGLRTNKADLTRHFINRRLNPAYDHLNDEQYLPRLTRIMGTI
jgi:hypothetical protein